MYFVLGILIQNNLSVMCMKYPVMTVKLDIYNTVELFLNSWFGNTTTNTGHKNVVSQDRWPLCGMQVLLPREYLAFQER